MHLALLHFGLSAHQLLALLSAALLGFVVAKAIYRLFFHPLANVPGPRLAAATWLYEVYYDLVQGGQFVFQLRRLHEKYGPIVRITPNELHVNDPDLIDLVYPSGGKTCCCFTPDHHIHRLRRTALNRYFSKQAVAKFEPFVRNTAQKLCDALDDYAGKEPVVLSTAFSSFATDIVTEYAFARCYHFLDRPGFQPNLQTAMDALADMIPLLKQAPWIHKLMRAIPPSWLLRMNPGMVDWMKLEEDDRNQIEETRARLEDQKAAKQYYTVFDELLKGSLPDEEKRTQRLFQEALLVVNAGSETTAWSLSVATYYLLSQPTTLSKLRKELEAAIANPSELPSLPTLEALPYLNATVTEALRCSYGVASRLGRILPEEPIYLTSNVRTPGYDQNTSRTVSYVVPPGYPVSMTSVLVHTNPDIFPNPYDFKPERWLDEDGKRTRSLDKYLLSFSKGTRQCLGLNLAYAELYICLAAIFRRLGDRLELYETTIEDIRMQRDVFVPRPKHGTKGIRVLVK
ncbi:cytochrome P450 [Cenococcum geophilum 1.58]|uniref:cytochrome P450 n=1 Tax=Cenococcum geophilum 1.58 TaxID=794803 RepID=UPI00358F2E56|nr:cytochrome P450 [Cenococcum geophilum 1.58]